MNPASNAQPTRVAVVGLGAFGRNHLRVFRSLQAEANVVLAAVVDPNETVRQAAALEYEVPAFASVEQMLASGLGIAAASVCVPTQFHAAVAAPLLAAGLDLLVEKPLARTLEEADALLALASPARMPAADRASRTLQPRRPGCTGPAYPAHVF